MSIVLCAVISPDVTLTVDPSALPQGPGGVALRFGLYDGPLCFTLTPTRLVVSLDEIDRQVSDDTNVIEGG